MDGVITFLLPYFEQGAIYDQVDRDKYAWHELDGPFVVRFIEGPVPCSPWHFTNAQAWYSRPTSWAMAQAKIGVLRCPSDTLKKEDVAYITFPANHSSGNGCNVNPLDPDYNYDIWFIYNFTRPQTSLA